MPFDSVYATSSCVLGEGSFGKVCLGTNLLTKQPVALKYMKNVNSYREFERELQILITLLPDCEDFVCLDGYGDHNGTQFIAMKLIDGEELYDFIDHETKISVAEFEQIAKQLLRQVANLHKLGFAHGDIKPANIMIEKVGSRYRTHLIDLGIGCSTPVCKLSGTYDYIPKSVIHMPRIPLAVRKRMDFFALAVTFKDLSPAVRIVTMTDAKQVADFITTAFEQSGFPPTDVLKRINRASS